MIDIAIENDKDANEEVICKVREIPRAERGAREDVESDGQSDPVIIGALGIIVS